MLLEGCVIVKWTQALRMILFGDVEIYLELSHSLSIPSYEFFMLKKA